MSISLGKGSTYDKVCCIQRYSKDSKAREFHLICFMQWCNLSIEISHSNIQTCYLEILQKLMTIIGDWLFKHVQLSPCEKRILSLEWFYELAQWWLSMHARTITTRTLRWQNSYSVWPHSHLNKSLNPHEDHTSYNTPNFLCWAKPSK